MAAEDYLRASMPWVGQEDIQVVFIVIELIQRLKVIVSSLGAPGVHASLEQEVSSQHITRHSRGCRLR